MYLFQHEVLDMLLRLLWLLLVGRTSRRLLDAELKRLPLYWVMGFRIWGNI